MFSINLGSPTVADDMILLSLSVNGLHHMLDIYYHYSETWRYEYNEKNVP